LLKNHIFVVPQQFLEVFILVEILYLRQRHPADDGRPKVCLQGWQRLAATERGGGSSSSRVGWQWQQQQRKWTAAAAILENWSRGEWFGSIYIYIE
jgi:hypothetical protein